MGDTLPPRATSATAGEGRGSRELPSSTCLYLSWRSWQQEGGKGSVYVWAGTKDTSVLLRRAHTAHHSVEEQLICKREDVMDEGLLDIAGRFPCLSPGEL